MRVADAGFTLLEAMVALAVIALVATAVLAQSAAGSRALADAAETAAAASLAEHRLESLRLKDQRELFPLTDSLRAGRFRAPLDDYAWRARVTSVSNLPGLIEAEVVVAWDGASFGLRTRWYRP